MGDASKANEGDVGEVVEDGYLIVLYSLVTANVMSIDCVGTW
jgi:hypothetical protein